MTSSAKSGWPHGTADFIRLVTATTHLRPLAHLACTAGTRAELTTWIHHLLGVGVRGFLAIRGDFPDGATAVPDGHLPTPTPSSTCRARSNPRTPPGSRGTARDRGRRVPVRASRILRFRRGPRRARGQRRLGADFAITQLFFDPRAYADLRRRAELAGITIPSSPASSPSPIRDDCTR